MFVDIIVDDVRAGSGMARIDGLQAIVTAGPETMQAFQTRWAARARIELVFSDGSRRDARLNSHTQDQMILDLV